MLIYKVKAVGPRDTWVDTHSVRWHLLVGSFIIMKCNTANPTIRWFVCREKKNHQSIFMPSHTPTPEFSVWLCAIGDGFVYTYMPV